MPIKMTPEDYFKAFTLGNYNDFIDNPSSVMRAFNSAVAATHLADCYYKYYKVNDPERLIEYDRFEKFLDYISNETNYYSRDINSIANAYKHLYPRDTKHPEYSTIASTGAIESIRFINEEVEQIFEEPIDTNASEFIVVYTRRTGEQVQFKKAIETVIDFWKTKIDSI